MLLVILAFRIYEESFMYLLSKKFIKKKSGFSLLELLVVLAIIGIILSFVVPNVINRPDDAKKAKVVNDISVILHRCRITERYEYIGHCSLENRAYPINYNRCI